jgi:hypothetical protein
MILDSERIDIEFMKLGVDYYVAGRCMARAQRLPVVGNLFHHAVEMMLKARLVQKHSLDDLRRLSHDLTRLWEAFKADFPGVDLREFNGTVASLAAFERIRYPDKILAEGMAARLEWAGPIAGPLNPERVEPEYVLVVNDIDLLTATIFRVSSRNPWFFIMVNDYARDVVVYRNPEADFLLAPH